MKNNSAITIWLTGLPSSGKSTIALHLKKELEQLHKHVEILDGDIIRKHLWNDLGFSKEDRIINLKRTIYLAEMLTRNNVITIVAFISPYRSIRKFARSRLQPFIEVYVKCKKEACIQRDIKGLYKKALQGKIKQFTGVSHEYEEPVNPEIIIETDKLTVKQCVNKISQFVLNFSRI